MNRELRTIRLQLREAGQVKVRYGRAVLRVKTYASVTDTPLERLVRDWRRGDALAEQIAWQFLRQQVVKASPTFVWDGADLAKLIERVCAQMMEPEMSARNASELTAELIALADQEEQIIKDLRSRRRRAFGARRAWPSSLVDPLGVTKAFSMINVTSKMLDQFNASRSLETASIGKLGARGQNFKTSSLLADAVVGKPAVSDAFKSIGVLSRSHVDLAGKRAAESLIDDVRKMTRIDPAFSPNTVVGQATRFAGAGKAYGMESLSGGPMGKSYGIEGLSNAMLGEAMGKASFTDASIKANWFGLAGPNYTSKAISDLFGAKSSLLEQAYKGLGGTGAGLGAHPGMRQVIKKLTQSGYGVGDPDSVIGKAFGQHYKLAALKTALRPSLTSLTDQAIAFARGSEISASAAVLKIAVDALAEDERMPTLTREELEAQFALWLERLERGFHWAFARRPADDTKPSRAYSLTMWLLSVLVAMQLISTAQHFDLVLFSSDHDIPAGFKLVPEQEPVTPPCSKSRVRPPDDSPTSHRSCRRGSSPAFHRPP